MPNIQKEAVDSSFKIRNSSKTCFDAKKVVRPLGQILTFFVLTKTFLFKASTGLQEKLNFLASAHNFLTFSKNWCLAISFNCSKCLLLRQKSGPPAWPDSYIFLFTKDCDWQLFVTRKVCEIVIDKFQNEFYFQRLCRKFHKLDMIVKIVK